MDGWISLIRGSFLTLGAFSYSFLYPQPLSQSDNNKNNYTNYKKIQQVIIGSLLLANILFYTRFTETFKMEYFSKLIFSDKQNEAQNGKVTRSQSFIKSA